MSRVISMHRPDDPRQTAVSDLSKVILCLLAPSFERSTLVVRAKQNTHSATVAPSLRHSCVAKTQLRLTHLLMFLILRAEIINDSISHSLSANLNNKKKIADDKQIQPLFFLSILKITT